MVKKHLNLAIGVSLPCRKFELEGNTGVKELPYEVFGNVSFKRISIEDTVIQRINETAILPSKDRLEWMTISNSRLEDFPFQILARLSRLKKLDLDNNYLTSMPAVRTTSLEKLIVHDNKISRVEEDGWETPNLKHLSMCE